jgi:glycosyltransferase involved in cell wall biosynthesis
MKILHISAAKAWGGNEQQLIYCIPELNKIGIENVVFGIKDSVLEKQCLINGFPFIQIKDKKLSNFSNFKYIKELLDKEKPDLLHLHTSNSLTFYVLSDFFLRLKIKTVFSKKAISASSSYVSKFKYNYKGIDAIFCVSKSVENNFSQVLSDENKKKLIVIPDCVSLDILNKIAKVDLRQKYAINKNNFIIGNIANHTDAKDLKTFIKVADYLINELKRDDVVFLQIGEFSKLTDEYLNIIKEKELEKFIIFTDKIEDASTLNVQFDVFLMTSQREGGPTSVLEAMLVGVPVVTTSVGIVPEVIIDGVNGYVAPIKDYVSLASKINLLLDDENLRKKIIKNGNSIINDNFAASVITKKYSEEYKKIINS